MAAQGSDTEGVQRRRFALWVMHPRVDEDQIDLKLLADVRRLLDEKIRGSTEIVDIDLWLESQGGSGDAAYRLALLLSGRARYLRVVVPSSARSAATLLALAADEIYMSDDAELGPLDAQIEHANGVVSARDVVRNFDLIHGQAIDLAASGAHRFRNDFALPASDALTPSAALASALIQSLITRVDPSLIFNANNLLDATEEYAKRLLKLPHERKRCAVTLAEQDTIREIARRLVRGYPTHDFVIDRSEAANLELKALPLSDYPMPSAVTEALDFARHSGEPVVILRELKGIRPEYQHPRRWSEIVDADGGADHRGVTRSSRRLNGHTEPSGSEHTLRKRSRPAVLDGRPYAQFGADAVPSRRGLAKTHGRVDVYRDDSWIWPLAPRPASESLHGLDDELVEVDLTEGRHVEKA